MGVTQSQVIALTKNIGNKENKLDMHEEALTSQKNVQLDGGRSQHDILKNKISMKASGTNSINTGDDMYNSLINFKKSGLLPNMLEKVGIKKKHLNESESPMIPMNSGGLSLIDKYSIDKKPILKELKGLDK